MTALARGSSKFRSSRAAETSRLRVGNAAEELELLAGIHGTGGLMNETKSLQKVPAHLFQGGTRPCPLDDSLIRGNSAIADPEEARVASRSDLLSIIVVGEDGCVSKQCFSSDGAHHIDTVHHGICFCNHLSLAVLSLQCVFLVGPINSEHRKQHIKSRAAGEQKLYTRLPRTSNRIPQAETRLCPCSRHHHSGFAPAPPYILEAASGAVLVAARPPYAHQAKYVRCQEDHAL